MAELEDRRYKISEVGAILDVPGHLLRQWESRIPQLKPKRDRANRRYYTRKDIEIARRIKHLIRHEKVTIEGVRLQLAQELHGEGRPKTRREVVDLVEKIQTEVRAMIDMLDSE